MFERYTESARRALFFARYETSLLGAPSIDTEHLLLGLIRNTDGVVGRIFARAQIPLYGLRSELHRRTTFREKVSTSVEIPFSASIKRVLEFAVEEADRLRHNYIAPEHLLLGLLREENSTAASVLLAHGLRLDEARTMVPAESDLQAAACKQIENIQQLVSQLVAMIPDKADAFELEARIHASLDRLKRHDHRPELDE